MNSLVEIPLTSFLVSLSGALAPGPLMVTTIRESSYIKSFKPGFLLALGHALAEAPITVMLTYGLLHVNEEYYPLISIVGGIVLVLTGLLASIKRGMNFKAEDTVKTHSPSTMVLLGATISISNPYWITWWLTIGSAYISKSLPWGALGIALFYISHEMGDIAVLGSISRLMASGARSLGEKGIKMLVTLCNLAIIVIGISFMLDGISSLV
ncbi:MAG: LysE family transporter [Thermoproteota archaeon]